jgi:hypothetical protein
MTWQCHGMTLEPVSGSEPGCDRLDEIPGEGLDDGNAMARIDGALRE